MVKSRRKYYSQLIDEQRQVEIIKAHNQIADTGVKTFDYKVNQNITTLLRYGLLFLFPLPQILF
jgi:hypothetical protein